MLVQSTDVVARKERRSREETTCPACMHGLELNLDIVGIGFYCECIFVDIHCCILEIFAVYKA